MIKNRPGRTGATLVEVVVASSLLLIAVTMAFRGYLHLMRQTALNDAQTELDINVQTSMERVKYDVRLSSLDMIFFYPAGPGPYTAMSFPMARDDDGDGAIDTDGDGNIIWDRTIVYHVWDTAPHQLRRTVFDPRDNTLTDLQRQEQLDTVVETGGGTGTHNGANATTEVVFENLFTWLLSPHGAIFDGYSPELSRELNVQLGSASLATGAHTFTFKVIGKNPASSGYKIGLDTLCVSPSYSVREAENQLPASAQSGTIADYELMEGGSWSGNYQLTFPATAAESYFSLSMGNDEWKETNFHTTGDDHDNTCVRFDQSFEPDDFVVALDGPGTNWLAASQSGDPDGGATPAGLADGAAIRVLLRGEEMEGGNWIGFNGARSRLRFAAAGSQAVDILCAYMAEADERYETTMNVSTGTQHQLTFGGSGGVTIPAGGSVESDYIDLAVEKEKSYLVSFLVGAARSGQQLKLWTDAVSPGSSTTFVVPASSAPDQAVVAEPDWSNRTDVVSLAALVGVESVYTTHPASGTYISSIFDTHCDSPAYNEINWNATVPTDTAIRIKVRTGNQADLSDAPDWESIAAIPLYGVIDPGNNRYVQFYAELDSDPAGLTAPKLRDFTIKWYGPQRVVDIGGTFTRGPDYGIFEVTVDGNDIVTAVTVDLEIFKETRGHRGTRRLTSRLAAEITPRNTGL